MRFREHLPGACWLATIALLACYFLYAGLERRSAASPARETVDSAARAMRRVTSVLPGTSGRTRAGTLRGGTAGDVVFSYQDVEGTVRELVLTEEDAARHLERLNQAPDLASFLQGFGNAPWLADAPLQDAGALGDWVRERVAGIDRISASEYPGWFRAAALRAADRFSFVPPPPAGSSGATER